MSDQNPNPALLAAMSAYFVFIVIFVLALLAFAIYMYWRIAAKAGYNGALSLLMLVPGANLVLLILFAFSDWPIERELRALIAGGAAPAPAPGWQPPAPTV